MDIHVVRGQLANLEEYCNVFCNSALYDHYFKDGDMLRDLLTKAIQKGQLYIALSSKDETIGVLQMTMDGMCGLPYLNLLGVKDRFRGMGIGTTLVNIFIGVAEESGYPNMFIMTSEFNVRAKKLYQSLGFKKYCLLPNLMKHGVGEYLFMRPSSKQSA
ncbi:GNAT family N-acetyltransferase [Oscillospiraceae bacterium PP1C4]